LLFYASATIRTVLEAFCFWDVRARAVIYCKFVNMTRLLVGFHQIYNFGNEDELTRFWGQKVTVRPHMVK